MGGLFVSIVFLLIAIGPATASNYYFPTAESNAHIYDNNDGDIISAYPPPEIKHDINSGDALRQSSFSFSKPAKILRYYSFES